MRQHPPQCYCGRGLASLGTPLHILVEKIGEHARNNAFAPALMSETGCITYADLLDIVIRVSNHFDDRKLPRLARVFVNIRNPDLRLAIIIAAIYYGLIPAIAAPETLRREFGIDFTIGGGPPLSPDVPADMVIDEAVLTGRFSDGRLRTFPERADDDLSYVCETSGVTGIPKLAGATYAAQRIGLDRHGGQSHYRAGDRVLFAFGGITRYAFGASTRVLADGGAIVGAPVDPIAGLKTIALFEVNRLVGTPKMMERTLDAVERFNLRCPTLKQIRITGSASSADLIRRIERAFAAEIAVGYGTTEVGSVASGVVTSDTYRRGFVGKITDGLQLVSCGTREEPAQIVLVNDRAAFTKYIRDGKVVEDDRPTFALPDLGYMENGNLFLTGRTDEVYNFSGHKRSYDAIAETIERLVSVKDIGIVDGAPVGHEDDLIVAIVAEGDVDLEDLSDRLLKTLGWPSAKPHFKFFQAPEIKRNSMGKIERLELLRAYAETRASAVAAG